MFFVYLIGQDIDSGYIGVTKNLSGRWNSHLRSKYLVGNYIRKHNLKFDMKVIFSGSEKECYDLEMKLRPLPYMGLNIAPGGLGGYTKYDKERSLKISKANRGKIRSEQHKKNLSDSIKKGGSRNKSNNPNSKQWSLTDPTGNVIMISGDMIGTCERLGLLWRTLYYKHKNQIVPPIQSGTFGGFRAKSKDHEKLRDNTTGWKLSEVK